MPERRLVFLCPAASAVPVPLVDDKLSTETVPQLTTVMSQWLRPA